MALTGIQRNIHLNGALLGHHHVHELVVVDLAITIHVSFADHLIHLLVSQLLAQVGHDVTQLCKLGIARVRIVGVHMA